ncbi:hypothetical protein [Persicobacter psychrovividus]|uniref:Uncharacterized protein n=1 Tax=Persicobacter psychrovividus TaxID=387638 RepID=A0ABM7VE56_9BACT|nr:hypothetical protein PEPS_15150 [Persicobacter psychrovividus]
MTSTEIKDYFKDQIPTMDKPSIMAFLQNQMEASMEVTAHFQIEFSEVLGEHIYPSFKTILEHIYLHHDVMEPVLENWDVYHIVEAAMNKIYELWQKENYAVAEKLAQAVIESFTPGITAMDTPEKNYTACYLRLMLFIKNRIHNSNNPEEKKYALALYNIIKNSESMQPLLHQLSD